MAILCWPLRGLLKDRKISGNGELNRAGSSLVHSVLFQKPRAVSLQEILIFPGRDTGIQSMVYYNRLRYKHAIYLQSGRYDWFSDYTIMRAMVIVSEVKRGRNRRPVHIRSFDSGCPCLYKAATGKFTFPRFVDGMISLGPVHPGRQVSCVSAPYERLPVLRRGGIDNSFGPEIEYITKPADPVTLFVYTAECLFHII